MLKNQYNEKSSRVEECEQIIQEQKAEAANILDQQEKKKKKICSWNWKTRQDLTVTASGCNSFPAETQSGTCSARTADNTAWKRPYRCQETLQSKRSGMLLLWERAKQLSL